MRRTSRLVGAVGFCAALVWAAGAAAGDWPQWRGPNRDGTVPGFTAPKTWPKALTQKWRVEVGLGIATPALVGERLFVFARQGNQEVVLCLNTADGKELWSDKHPAPTLTGPSARQSGPRSSPAVAEGKVVTLGVGGTLSCLNAADGKVVWRKDPFKTVPRFYTAMSPIIVDKMAVAHLGGQGKGAIIAFDLATGDEKWRWDEEAPEYASPVLMTVEGTRQIVTLTAKSVVGVAAADGKLLWRIPFAAARRSYNTATPIVDGQTVICTGRGRGTTAARIEKTGDGFAPRQLWSNPDVAVQFSTPVLRNGLLFGLSDGGNLFCIDARTGKTAWKDAAQHGRGFAAIVAAGSAILALPTTSELIVFEPGAEKYVELARIKVADTPTYAHPVISGSTIYVRDQNTITKWAID